MTEKQVQINTGLTPEGKVEEMSSKSHQESLGLIMESFLKEENKTQARKAPQL